MLFTSGGSDIKLKIVDFSCTIKHSKSHVGRENNFQTLKHATTPSKRTLPFPARNEPFHARKEP